MIDPGRFPGFIVTDHPLKGLYLTRHYREGSDPFAVISDLPRETAIELCTKFASQRRVGDGSGGQAAYFDGRIETENWLRESAQNAGVEIKKQNPVYFTLTTDDQTLKAHDGMKAVSIPAEQADLKSCSFTFGDSMGNRTSNAPPESAHPLQDAVLNAGQAAKAIATYGIAGDYLNGGRYIEVQMWAQPDEPRAAAVTSAKTSPKISSSATL